jgi:hypothetical protein
MKKPSKIQQALELIAKGENPHRASQIVGLAQPSSLYAYIAKEKLKAEGKCPCCGQNLPENQK